MAITQGMFVGGPVRKRRLVLSVEGDTVSYILPVTGDPASPLTASAAEMEADGFVPYTGDPLDPET